MTQSHYDVALEELKKFQNEDGGFGNALEPDYRARNSSVLATNAALAAIQWWPETLGLSSVVERAVAWLLGAYDASSRIWPLVPMTGDAEPHAPWWSASGLAKEFSGFALNPTSETAGWLVRFGNGQARALGLSLAQELLDRWHDDGLAGSAGALACGLRLVTVEGFPHSFRSSLTARLAPLVSAHVERRPEKWGEYNLKPYQAMPSPSSPGAEPELVRRSLEWLATQQQADGSLAPTWSWFGHFPEVWPVAEREWRGILCLEALHALETWRGQ